MVGLDSVCTFILQRVRANLIEKPNSAALLTKIEKNTSSLFRNLPHRCMKLRATITAHRPERVTSQTFRMNSDQYRLSVFDITHDKSNMFLVIQLVRVDNRLKLAKRGRETGFCLAFHQLLRLFTISNQISNRNQLEVMPFCNFLK